MSQPAGNSSWWLGIGVCFHRLTAKHNFKCNYCCVQTCLGAGGRNGKHPFVQLWSRLGSLEAKEEGGLPAHDGPGAVLARWLDPSGALATDVSVEQQHCITAIPTAGVKGEAIYINYWRAVNIIS